MTGLELKAMRLAAGLTQVELASRLQVHSVTVANWERGVFQINGRTEQLVRLHCVPKRVKVLPKKSGEKS